MDARTRMTLLVTLASVTLAASCRQILGVGGVSFTGGSGGAGAGGSTTSSMGGGSTTSVASSSNAGGMTSSSSSVASSSNAGGMSTSSSSSGSPCVDPAQPCDCDGDGDNANTPECDYDGGDCNDHDPLVNSKQTMWFDMPGSNGWDYNCDGQDEYEVPDELSCGFEDCDTSTQKWSGSVPDCGQMGPYATCSENLETCEDGTDLGMRTQGCH